MNSVPRSKRAIAATLMRWAAEIDLSGAFPAVQAPTLFLERANRPAVNSASVRAAAALTPNGRYVEVPGNDQLLFLGDPEPALGEIEEFLTGARRQIDPDRMLSTVPFTDIVGSTDRQTGSAIAPGLRPRPRN